VSPPLPAAEGDLRRLRRSRTLPGWPRGAHGDRLVLLLIVTQALSILAGSVGSSGISVHRASATW